MVLYRANAFFLKVEKHYRCVFEHVKQIPQHNINKNQLFDTAVLAVFLTIFIVKKLARCIVVYCLLEDAEILNQSTI